MISVLLNQQARGSVKNEEGVADRESLPAKQHTVFEKHHQPTLLQSKIKAFNALPDSDQVETNNIEAISPIYKMNANQHILGGVQRMPDTSFFPLEEEKSILLFDD